MRPENEKSKRCAAWSLAAVNPRGNAIAVGSPVVAARSGAFPELIEATGYSRPHTVHCGPHGIYVSALGNANGDAPGGVEHALDSDFADFASESRVVELVEVRAVDLDGELPGTQALEVPRLLLLWNLRVGSVSHDVAALNCAFMSLIGKVLPIQVTGEDGGPVKHSIKVSFG